MIERRTVLGAVAATAAVTLAETAQADPAARAVVEAIYSRIFSVGGSPDVMAEADKLMAPNFESIGDYSGKSKKREELAKQIQMFHQLIPDLTWTPVEIIESGNRFVVRSKATGTPKGPLFGVDGKGKSFAIMSIDIHEVNGGQVTRVHHVEDWAGALRQLAAQ